MPSMKDYIGGDEVSVDVTSHCIQDIGMTPTSINGLLIERGIKMIPWSCGTLEDRQILAAAFRGTRLEQWLDEWCSVSFVASICTYFVFRTPTIHALLQLVEQRKVMWYAVNSVDR